MARVWKEAQRVKGVLSANTDSTIRLESISGDIDFKDTISRATFEDMAKDLAPRFSQPIADALNAANLKLEDIKSVILVGGASRTPMVQSAVKALVGDKVALGVNADEAAALGAAFYGATTKTSWRTRPMKFLDVNAYDMQMKYFKEGSNKQFTSVVLPSMSKLGRQSFKRLTFPKRSQDFEVELEYKSLPDSQTPVAVVKAKLSGVAGALANLTSQGVQTPQVRVSFGYSDSGLAVVEDAVAVGELTRVVEPSKSASDDKKAKSTGSQTTTSTSESQESTKAATEEAPKTETVTVTAPIDLQITPLSLSPLSTPEKQTSRSRLAEIAAREAAKAKREQAFNLLEGFLYRLRDLLEDDSNPFHEFAQPDEQARLSDKLATTMSWLHDEGEEAAADVLLAKRAELENIEQPIITRYQEASTGPKALSDLQKAHALARAFLTEAKANQTAAVEAGETPRFTDDDLKSVDTLVTESENWLRERTQQQKKLTKRQDPALKTAEMESKGVAIQKLVLGLQKRKPYRPKTTSTTKSATATPTQTTESGESQPTDKENRSREEL
ncbi:lumenal Hsp70 protein [Tulasnella sp. 408]|nr:lumenal Hsp70 protein [Tulasnella sp. 408]